MEQNATHLTSWDIRVTRQWSAFYATHARPLSPVVVNIAAEFDDDEASLEFERKIREILQ